MTQRLRVVLLGIGLAAIAPSGGCTAVAALFTSQAPACVDDGDCFAGYRCESSVCVEVTTPILPPIVPPEAIGSEGGTVLGPNGIELIIPEGAISGAATVTIEPYTVTFVPPNVDAATPVYVIRPAIQLDRDATLSVPVAGCDASCFLFLNTTEFDDRFTMADNNPGVRDGVATGDLDRFGLFVVGTQVPVLDGGHDPEPDPDGGMMPVDGGADVDAGPTLFDACDFSPDSCQAGEQCVPDPFAPGAGRCLTLEGACDAACACCGPLSDEVGAPSFCLPADLCGAGVVGDACTDDSGCSPVTTDGCHEVGDALRCTVGCTAATEGGACGAGCCLPDPLTPDEGWCAPAAACTEPVGALCLTDAACGVGTCTSVDGQAPARCSIGCTLDDVGACGPDLCCFATDCAGNGQCVPDGACADQGLVCTDTCLADDACPGGLCDRGSCISAATCECLDHADCGAGERCLIDGATQTTCEAGGDCCGTCVTTVAPACFVHDDCGAADGGPAACEPAADAGCVDDPFVQCPGSCAPPSGDCLADDDCPGAQRCVQQECR